MTTGSAYDVFDDPYCYPNSMVLINLMGLGDAANLADYELEMTTLRADEPMPEGAFDPAHYKALHFHLFQDVYDWAGQYRTVRTAKASATFCYPEHIASEMNGLFSTLGTAPFLPASALDEFLTALAEFLGELNAIHPFRDGNGRTQLSFTQLLAERAGHPMDLARIDPASMLDAMIRSFHGDALTLKKVLARLVR